MIPEHESAPPIRDLPAEIEAAESKLVKVALDMLDARVNERRPKIFDAIYEADRELRQAIRAALDDQDAALRERCERLRQALNITIIHLHDEVFDWMMAELKPGDLADNLVAKSSVDEEVGEHGR